MICSQSDYDQVKLADWGGEFWEEMTKQLCDNSDLAFFYENEMMSEGSLFALGAIQ